MLVFFALAIFVSSSLPCASAEVLKITVNDTIQPITEEYIARAIDEAHRRNDQALLIEINTPGGLVESTRQIIEKITASPVPVIIYVTPGGSRAASAGFFILEVGRRRSHGPGNEYRARRIRLRIGGGNMDEVMKQKMENDAAALMRSVAPGADATLRSPKARCAQSKSFTEQEALSQHLIDYVASSEDDLFRQIAGQELQALQRARRHAQARRRSRSCLSV